MKKERDMLAEPHSFIWNQVKLLLAVQAGGQQLTVHKLNRVVTG